MKIRPVGVEVFHADSGRHVKYPLFFSDFNAA